MSRKILIVDDNQLTLNIVKDALDYMGYHAKTLSDPGEIFNEIEAFKPDLILLDFFLGDINGGEICHQIKTHPATAGLPVVIISGYTRVLLSLGTYGCDGILPKPFGLDELRQLLQSKLPVTTARLYE